MGVGDVVQRVARGFGDRAGPQQPAGGFGYQTFNGAYGRTGAAAETAYLDRTAYWAAEFEARRGTSPAVNLALHKPATADSSCNANEGAAKAVNGSVSGGNCDKWCSLGASKWLRVDLGTQATVGRFVLRHAGAGGEPARFDTQGLRHPGQYERDGLDDCRERARQHRRRVDAPDRPGDRPVCAGRRARADQDTDPAARIYELEAYSA